MLIICSAESKQQFLNAYECLCGLNIKALLTYNVSHFAEYESALGPPRSHAELVTLPLQQRLPRIAFGYITEANIKGDVAQHSTDVASLELRNKRLCGLRAFDIRLLLLHLKICP